jgi:hypothetical protein
MSEASTRGRRAVALLVIVVLGVMSRRYPVGVPLYDKSLGDLLYAVAIYLVLGLARPRWPPVTLAGAAFGACFLVELLQLTGLPARYAHLSPVRWLLGTHFAWQDILCYALGVFGAAAVDRCGKPDAGLDN